MAIMGPAMEIFFLFINLLTGKRLVSLGALKRSEWAEFPEAEVFVHDV